MSRKRGPGGPKRRTLHNPQAGPRHRDSRQAATATAELLAKLLHLATDRDASAVDSALSKMIQEERLAVTRGLLFLCSAGVTSEAEECQLPLHAYIDEMTTLPDDVSALLHLAADERDGEVDWTVSKLAPGERLTVTLALLSLAVAAISRDASNKGITTHERIDQLFPPSDFAA